LRAFPRRSAFFAERFPIHRNFPPQTGHRALARYLLGDPRMNGRQKPRFRQAPLWARLLFAVVLVAGAAASARADFYKLDGRFQCLGSAEASCGGAGRAELLPPLPPKPPAKEAVAFVAPPVEPPVQAHIAPASPKPARPAAPRDPILVLADNVKDGRVSPEDLQRLRTLSHAGNAHATELLAWCDYKGIGVPRDPVAAYVLYGIAALAGVSHARANQAVIYEYALSSDQRQKVLDIQNEIQTSP
jgi:TPR repeat protein